ncbi:MAG: L-seryl-tRNA(Sec) selenium transferase [Thermodesulfobacteriota bacterium]|nr:L-seryl-tRNA(Sec) selenium transferase [Thermodesulfobacteriota bacterium]
MEEKDRQRFLRMLPSIDKILQHERVINLLEEYPRWLVVKITQQVVEEERTAILSCDRTLQSDDSLNLECFSKKILQRISVCGQMSLKSVINATGVIVHTNLGRSLLNYEILKNMEKIASNYSNLEYNLEQGKRGSRYSHIEDILCELTGAQAALVVNNNAGAVLIALNSIANDREVIVSRGQLVEIGGSFRIPDVMKESGAKLIEVGTTNKTHLVDYKGAINEQTALLLKVHTSNFQIIGFTSEVKLEELVELGREHSLPVMEDLGSGCIIELGKYGLTREPTVQEAIRSGVDVVTFSGDKLLGGPQAGIILGKEKIIEKIRKNPIHRALRIDKLTLAALESTLHLYMEGESVIEKIPTLRMLTLPMGEIEKKAKSLYRRLRDKAGNRFHVEIKDDISRAGGGALPLQDLPTKVIAVKPVSLSVDNLEERLRENNPPVISRIEDDQVLLDVRTLQKGDAKIIEKAIKKIFAPLCE